MSGACAPPVSSATSIQRDQPQAFANPNLARLVAGTVSGSIDFSADQPQPSREALSIYRHPADRNAAATGVQAGRLVDIDG